jgi:hypothetical protein
VSRALRASVRCAVVALVLAAGAASAQRAQTVDALDRMVEELQPAVEDGALQGSAPVIVVGATPAFEETRTWFPTAAIAAAARAFGGLNLRACEACMAPRLNVVDGRLEHTSGAPSLEEIVAIDTRTRGTSAPARTAAWIDETAAGVSVRVISLDGGAVLFARNFDGALRELRQTRRNFTFSEEVERRLRGDTLTHVFIDAALLPGQHVSLDVVDQFGDDNLNLAGVTVSAFDPVIGVGAAYHRVIPQLFNLSLGAQVVVSVPTALGSALGLSDVPLLDPALTGVLVARWPIPQTSYAVLLMASTNGRVGVGVSLMNFSLLPILP